MIIRHKPIAFFTLDNQIIRLILIWAYWTIHLTWTLTTLTVIPHPGATESWIFDPTIFTNSTPVIEYVWVLILYGGIIGYKMNSDQAW